MIRDGTDLLVGYAREPLQILAHSGSIFKVFKQRGNGYSRTAETPLAT